RADRVENRDPEPEQDQPAIAPQKREIPGVGRGGHAQTTPSPPPFNLLGGAERVGVRWGIPERSPTSPSRRCAMGPSLSPLKGGEGFTGFLPVLQLDIGWDVLGLDAVDRQPAIEPLAPLLNPAAVVDPGIEEIAPVLVGLLAHPHAGRQLDARVLQHLKFAERWV